MTNQQLATGVAHEIPADLRKALLANKTASEKWQALTPLARNEWICWTVTTKKPETRQNHVERTVTELVEGKRRPCCWVGCIHRTDKKPGAWAQKVLIDKRPRTA